MGTAKIECEAIPRTSRRLAEVIRSTLPALVVSTEKLSQTSSPKTDGSERLRSS